MKDNKQEALDLLREYSDNCRTIIEDRTDYIISRLEQISPDHQISDYIFYTENEDMTPEEIVENIFSYKPIQL